MGIQVIDSRRYLQEFSIKNALPLVINLYLVPSLILSVGDCEKANMARNP